MLYSTNAATACWFFVCFFFLLSAYTLQSVVSETTTKTYKTVISLAIPPCIAVLRKGQINVESEEPAVGQ